MAKKPYNRWKSAKYIRGNIDEELTMTTLAARTLVSTLFDETVTERTYISSIDASYVLSDFTPGAGIGPFMVGVAHSDYSDSEIEAVIELANSWAEADLVSQELAKRKIRKIGIFPMVEATSVEHAVLNDGLKIHTRLGWILTVGQTLRLWAYNLGTAAVATTVPTVNVIGHANLWPK